MSIQQYSQEDFKKLKKAGSITAQALDFLDDKKALPSLYVLL